MPIYEYSCRHCHASFEELVLPGGQAATCPECASAEVERQLSVFRSPAGPSESKGGVGGCGCTPSTCGCH